MLPMTNLIVVFVGVGLGSLCRYGLGLLLPSDNFPLGTLVANVLACLVLGYLTGYLSKHHISSQWSLLIGTGFCGGFSTFSKEALLLQQEQSMGTAIGYSLLSIIIGLTAVYIGIYWGQQQN